MLPGRGGEPAMTGMGNFADRLCEAIARKGNAVVVGLDPRLESLPENLLEGADEYGDTTVPQPKRCGGLIVILLTQCTIWCQRSNHNWRSMNATALPVCRRMCKRCVMRVTRVCWSLPMPSGTILAPLPWAMRRPFGPTEVFAQTVPGDFEADALTVNAFLGSDGITPFIDPCPAAWSRAVCAGENVQCLVERNPGRRCGRPTALRTSRRACGSMGCAESWAVWLFGRGRGRWCDVSATGSDPAGPDAAHALSGAGLWGARGDRGGCRRMLRHAWLRCAH